VNPSMLDLLVDPVSLTPLRASGIKHDAHGNIQEATLEGDNRSYRIRNGIPRFVLTQDAGQNQTADSFGFKWRQTTSYGSEKNLEFSRNWLFQRYGFKDLEDTRRYFRGRGRILDAGCGSGYSSSLWMDKAWGGREWVGLDISAAIDVAQDRLGSVPNTHFVQADMLLPPFKKESFDTVFAEGVLHHSPSTEAALQSVTSLLKPGGEILFYVYRKKSPIREYTDDYIRDLVSPLSPDVAWETLKPLTRLAQSLAELRTKIQIPEDIPLLGINAGEYDIQRFFYWHIAKLFWNFDLDFEANHHANFDWYHPRYAHRQTEEQIRAWCTLLRLKIHRWDAQESGFTVRAIKA